MMRCARCKAVFYCGAECQRIDWRVHEPDCKKANLLGKGEGCPLPACNMPPAYTIKPTHRHSMCQAPSPQCTTNTYFGISQTPDISLAPCRAPPQHAALPSSIRTLNASQSKVAAQPIRWCWLGWAGLGWAIGRHSRLQELLRRRHLRAGARRNLSDPEGDALRSVQESLQNARLR